MQTPPTSSSSSSSSSSSAQQVRRPPPLPGLVWRRSIRCDPQSVGVWLERKEKKNDDVVDVGGHGRRRGPPAQDVGGQPIGGHRFAGADPARQRPLQSVASAALAQVREPVKKKKQQKTKKRWKENEETKDERLGSTTTSGVCLFFVRFPFNELGVLSQNLSIRANFNQLEQKNDSEILHEEFDRSKKVTTRNSIKLGKTR